MKNNELSDNKWFAVVNPNAGNRAIKREWKMIHREMTSKGLNFDYALTEHPFHTLEIVDDALKKGYRKIIAIGGDGTLNEAANAMLDFKDFHPDTHLLALIPAGTGNDWGRMFNVPKKGVQAVKTVIKGKEFTQDVGVITYFDNGQQKKRYFINIAGMGFDALVAQKTNKQRAEGKSNAYSYLINLLTSFLQYKPSMIQVEIDGTKYNFNAFSISVGICRYNGGGIMQLPNAIPDDGLLDITIIKKFGLGSVLSLLRNLYNGQFVKHPKVSTFTAKRVTILSKKPGFMMEADGESLGQAPFEITIIPRSLRLIIGSWNSQ
ncbi:MAG TPA: diacylglycerol kinase family lipid kinase [Bacteroidales bacterium]|nr:diacylglycerol kinase family lipid kinase [Bacteroidales bacterium]HQF01758.1 diacylglycerol kinase family lipid kinase [Bacteroidales bacterium]